MRGELWMEIRDFPQYLVSNHGRVYSVKTGTLLKARSSGWGYLQVMLSDGHNNQTTKSIHILVAEAFVPGWSDGLEPNHKDGNKENNHESNLEWAPNVRITYTRSKQDCVVREQLQFQLKV